MSTDDAPASSPASGTLFERIGGVKTLINGVDVLCEMVLEDDMLAPLFVGVDMGWYRIKQVRVRSFVVVLEFFFFCARARKRAESWEPAADALQTGYECLSSPRLGSLAAQAPT
jgi:hypothetical protein